MRKNYLWSRGESEDDVDIVLCKVSKRTGDRGKQEILRLFHSHRMTQVGGIMAVNSRSLKK